MTMPIGVHHGPRHRQGQGPILVIEQIHRSIAIALALQPAAIPPLQAVRPAGAFLAP